ncbi:MAG TPA: methyl-accepting chemotaxis protein, partial [Longimicrobium sp.]|nr:methyl-accepting chemotaxis protein [Longimicrobium sp.]
MRNFTISTRLLAFGVLGVVLVLCVGAAGHLGIRRVSAAMRSINQSTALLRLQGDVDMMHDAIRADAYGALLAAERGRAVDAAEMAEHEATLRTALDGVASAPDAELAARVGAAREALDTYVAAGREIATTAGRDRAAALGRLGAFEQRFAALETELAAVTDHIEKGAGAAEARGGRAARTAVLAMAGTTALALVVMLFIAATLTRGIVLPLREAVDVNRRLSEGDLTARAEPRGADEVGAMLDSLNLMAARLRGTIGRIGAMSGTLAESST